MTPTIIIDTKKYHKLFYLSLVILFMSVTLELKAQPICGDWCCSTDFGNFTFTVNFQGTKINKLIFEVVNWECGNVSGSWTTTIEWPEPNGWSISDNQFYIDRVISGEGWIVSGKFNQTGTEVSGTWSYQNGWGTVCPGNWGPIIVTSIDERSDGIPQRTKLCQNYPNPFNPKTLIKYSIQAKNKITNSKLRSVVLRVYDTLGNELATLVNEEQEPGNYEVEFNGKSLTSGFYFYRLQSIDFIETKKMLLIK